MASKLFTNMESSILNTMSRPQVKYIEKNIKHKLVDDHNLETV